MKRAALGVHMHSGGGVLVAVSQDAGPVEIAGILDRRRIVTADAEIPGAVQPYHYASRLEFSASEKYLANCEAASSRLASTAIAEVTKELQERHFRTTGAAVLLASGRPLPTLAKILASHRLIHTAEGEFFRHALIGACEGLHIPVTAIRERKLDTLAKAVFGNAARRLQNCIANLGSSIGPPWTRDHKSAALAAALILGSHNTGKLTERAIKHLA